MPKSKAYSNPLPSMADEQRYGTKCHELRTKIREIERENQNIQLKIHQSKKNISRLRIERSVLYEALAAITTTAAKAAELPIPPQLQQPDPGHALYSTSNSIPSASVPSTHNGYHPQNVSTTNPPFNDAVPPPNNHAPAHVPNQNFNRSTEPVSLNGITGLLNSNNNPHHPPRPPMSHNQYSQSLPAQQAQITNHRIPPNPHQLAPIAVDPTTNTRYSSAASDSPTASSNHFSHHQLGGRSMSATSHHHHNGYPSPHHHHHHHHQHIHSNPSSTSALPGLRNRSTGPQNHSNGNGIPLRPDARGEVEGEDEEEEDEEEEEEEEEEPNEVDGSIKAGSTSLRPADDEMEIDAEGDDE